MMATESIMNRVAALLRVIDSNSGATESERANAQVLLDKLLAKHQLSVDDFDTDKRVKHKFICKTKTDFTLLLHIVGTVLNTPRVHYERYRNQYYFELSQSEYVDVNNMLKNLKPALNQTLNV